MKWLQKWGGLVLFLGFLWLGVPRCVDGQALRAEDRRQVELLCKKVEWEHALAARPDMLRREEWLLVLARYRRAEAAETRNLNNPASDFPDLTGPVLQDLSRRLEGKR